MERHLQILRELRDAIGDYVAVASLSDGFFLPDAVSGVRRVLEQRIGSVNGGNCTPSSVVGALIVNVAHAAFVAHAALENGNPIPEAIAPAMSRYYALLGKIVSQLENH